jgi:protoheme IX farnesyltransferase
LCKPKVVLLVAFTAVVGMFLSTAGAPPLGAFVFGTLGIALAAASGAALNHVADRHIDVVMARPSRRHARRTVRARNNALGFLAGVTRRR